MAETAHALHNREDGAEYPGRELVVESLLEPRPPADATSSYRQAQDLEWARRWPMEHIWRVRRI